MNHAYPSRIFFSSCHFLAFHYFISILWSWKPESRRNVCVWCEFLFNCQFLEVNYAIFLSSTKFLCTKSQCRRDSLLSPSLLCYCKNCNSFFHLQWHTHAEFTMKRFSFHQTCRKKNAFEFSSLFLRCHEKRINLEEKLCWKFLITRRCITFHASQIFFYYPLILNSKLETTLFRMPFHCSPPGEKAGKTIVRLF